jgi:hypothetical protein
MKFKFLMFGIATAAMLAITAGARVDVSKLPKPAEKQVDFSKDIKPLLEASCLKCHGEQRPKSRYRVNDREEIIKGGSSGEAAIIPGNSEKSPFIHYIADLVDEMEMPPLENRDNYPALTKEQVALFRAWIDQGVKWEE